MDIGRAGRVLRKLGRRTDTEVQTPSTPAKRLGLLAVIRGHVTPAQLERALDRRAETDDSARAFGMSLVREGFLSEEHLASLLREMGAEGDPAWPRFDRYEVLGKAGEGGMASVYRARDRQLDRAVAIKVLRDRWSGALRERLLREARVLAGLNHPHVVKMFDAGDIDGQPYLAMEWVDGSTLAARMGGRAWKVGDALRLMEKIARGVAAAHGQGVVHRDLKPGNILIAHQGEPKVADFGLARWNDATALTRSNAVIGTPQYMAPEQIEGKSEAISPRTDVYALGAILFELLAGRPLHRGRTFEELAASILSDRAPPLSAKSGSPAVRRIVARALARNPEDRYPTAKELAEDLARVGTGGRAARAAVPGARWMLAATAGILGACAAVWVLARPSEELGAVETALSRAERSFRRGSIDHAQLTKEVAEALASFEPKSAAEHFVVGRVRARLGERRAAERSFLQALQASPDFSAAHMELGRLLLEEGFLALQYTSLEDQRLTRARSLKFVERATAHLAQATVGRGADPIQRDRAQAMLELARGDGAAVRRIAEEAIRRYGDVDAEFRWMLSTALSGEARLASLDRALAIDPHHTGARFLRAVALAESERFDLASADYDALLRVDPRFPMALVRRAELRERQGDLRGALSDLNTAVTFEDRRSLVRLRRAGLQLQMGRWDDAESELEEFLRLEPERADLYFHNRAEVVLAKADRIGAAGRGDEARAQWREAEALASRAIQAEPRFAKAYFTRAKCRDRLANDEAEALRAAVEDLDRAIEHGFRRGDVYMLRGHARLRLGDYEGAEEDAGEALRQAPEDTEAFRIRGLARGRKGALREAVADFTEVLKRLSDDRMALENRGLFLSKLKEFDGALADFGRVLDRVPNAPEAWVNRAAVRKEQGEFAKALEDLARALALRPDFADALAVRGWVHRRRGDWPAAIADFTKVIELEPAGARGFAGRANVYGALQRWGDAAADYTRALERDPRQFAARLERGGVLATLGRLEEALADLTEAIRLRPDDARAYVSRGGVYLQQGLLTEARADLDRAIALNDRDCTAYLNRGLLRRREGDRRGAEADFRSALECDPSPPQRAKLEGLLELLRRDGDGR